MTSSANPSSHYPSWGSGTSRTCAPSYGRRRAHYPSWGSGTASAVSIACSPTISLPLMGIRNHRPVEPHCAGRGLTTPHGDQEPFSHSRRVSGVLSSLPLMGIRNTPIRLGVYDAGVTSLPLMGIRNRGAPACVAPRVGPSLPLMGIRNRPPLAIAWTISVLTTPHGDQERRRPFVHVVLYELSLPLMGIRNGESHPWHSWRHSRLTTPHGDQELIERRHIHPSAACSLPLMGIRNVRSASSTRPFSKCSLPLMGIRNRHMVQRRRVRQRLTTPHGDQEPESR